MDRATAWSIHLIAIAAVVAGLFFFRDTLTQFSLALILWLGIEGMARWLDQHISFMPRWLALPLALVFVLSLVGLVGYGVAVNIGAFAARSAEYTRRLDEIVAVLHSATGAGGSPPTVDTMLRNADLGQWLGRIADGFRGIASDAVFVLIYLGFLFAAAANFPRKLDRMFAHHADREHARDILTAIRHSMEEYLWVQTVISVIISALTYATLVLAGMENALFWSFLIFFLNYIPTIGSIAATILPTLFALVEFNSLLPVAFVAAGVGGWQFVIGNVVQPRMMGTSLNLSAVVVLLSLALWGTVWGIAGAFLSAPLTVMIMIVLAQFPSTRWLAILLSADGKPPRIRRHQKPPAEAPAT